jgi:hypothetical protein
MGEDGEAGSGGMSRREFLERIGRLGGAALVSGLGAGALAGEMEQGLAEHWSEGGFRQTVVDASREAEGVVRARLADGWRELRTVELPDAFMQWNVSARLDMLDRVEAMMAGEGGPPSLAGPHNAAMATWGAARRDSTLTVNNAFKGMGLCPRRELIGSFSEKMRSSSDAPLPEKLALLREVYSSHDNFDRTKLVSLELYSTPEFETHTFLNLMEHPSTSLVFLDSKSYEVRGVGQLVDPDAGSGYAADIVEYTNLAHSYFHGDFPRLFPGILVHVTAVFDNTPGTGRGVRVAPVGG